MEVQEQEPGWKNTVVYAFSWFMSCLLLVLALLNTFEFIRTVLDWITASISNIQKARDFGWTVTAITEGMFFVGGIIAVALAVWFEFYFRKGDRIGKLYSRVFKVLLVEVIVIVLMIVGRIIIMAIGF